MTRTTDPELAAMTTIVRALADLDEDTRQRVLRWATTRYAPPLQTIEAPTTTASQPSPQPDDENPREEPLSAAPEEVPTRRNAARPQ